MRKGFTLLEIIVVLIILGIIATLGFMQYTRVIEKGRTAEAKTNLGTLRTMAMAYYEEHGVHIDAAYIASVLNLPTDACNSNYYFQYDIQNTDDATGDFEVVATRCVTGSGGKAPDYSGTDGAYSLILDQDGVASTAGTPMW